MLTLKIDTATRPFLGLNDRRHFFFFFFFFLISQFRVHSSSIEFLGFSGMYIKIGDDTSKLWVIREHDSMYKFIQNIDIKPSVNSSIVRLVHEFIQHFNFK